MPIEDLLTVLICVDADRVLGVTAPALSTRRPRRTEGSITTGATVAGIQGATLVAVTCLPLDAPWLRPPAALSASQRSQRPGSPPKCADKFVIVTGAGCSNGTMYDLSEAAVIQRGHTGAMGSQWAYGSELLEGGSSMSFPAMSGDELVTWVEQTSVGWRQLIDSHPEAMNLPCDIRETSSVGQLLQHIVAVELRYAERLSGLPVTSYDAIPYDSSGALFGTHDHAMAYLRQLEDQDESFWSETIDLSTRSGGELRATRRVVFVHLFMHSIRHYAQLATLLRRNGIVPHWPMDFLFLQ